MYRNCKCKNMCPYSCENNDMETICDNVANTVSDYKDCDCGFDEDDGLFPQNPMFGQSYVPWQTMNKTFTPEAGLRNGTIFPELVSPYIPCQSIEEINHIEATNVIGEGCNKC